MEADAAANYHDGVDESCCESVAQLNAITAWELRRQDYITTLGEDDITDDDSQEEIIVDEYDDDDGGDTTTVLLRSNPRTGAAATAARSAKGVISQQAQKIQHFARREMELQRSKKDRDDGNGRYVKEVGG